MSFSLLVALLLLAGVTAIAAYRPLQLATVVARGRRRRMKRRARQWFGS